jgi:hypothetical protein
MQGFPIKSLPRSLQDAVKVVKKLKIRYLWIDSPRILQDDKRDWHYESAMMASMYQNAFITIAATGPIKRCTWSNW